MEEVNQLLCRGDFYGAENAFADGSSQSNFPMSAWNKSDGGTSQLLYQADGYHGDNAERASVDGSLKL